MPWLQEGEVQGCGQMRCLPVNRRCNVCACVSVCAAARCNENNRNYCKQARKLYACTALSMCARVCVGVVECVCVYVCA